MHICPCHQFTQTQKRAEKSAQKELEVESRVCLHLDYLFEKRQKRQKEAPARFELTISCLLDRRFNQLSHGAVLDSKRFFKKFTKQLRSAFDYHKERQS